MSTNTANLTNYHSKSPRRDLSDYRDILHHPRPKAPYPMPRSARAAQFSPYAALVGHKEIIAQDEASAQNQIDLDHDITLDTSTADFEPPDL